jgi:membrane protein
MTHAHRLRTWVLSRSPALKRTVDTLSNPVTTNPATQQRDIATAEPPT